MGDALNPESGSVLTLPTSDSDSSLSSTDLQTFSLAERWMNGESLAVLAEEIQFTKEGLRKRIKSCAYRYSGSEQLYLNLVESVILNKMIDDEEALETATDSVAATRAREGLKHSQWLAERRLPRKFAPKQQFEIDKTINVYVQRAPQQVVVEGQVVESLPVSTQNNTDPTV